MNGWWLLYAVGVFVAICNELHQLNKDEDHRMSRKTRQIHIFHCDVCGEEKESTEKNPAKNISPFPVVAIEGKDYHLCNHCFNKMGYFFKFLIETVGISFHFDLVSR